MCGIRSPFRDEALSTPTAKHIDDSGSELGTNPGTTYNRGN